MHINGIDGLLFNNQGFEYHGFSYSYSGIRSIVFDAMITRVSESSSSSREEYDATLKLLMGDGGIIDVRAKAGFWGGMKRTGLEALQQAHAIFAELSFNHRIARYEEQVARAGFFRYGNYQFHQSGHLFRKGRELLLATDRDVVWEMAPFTLTIRRDKRSVGQWLKSKFVTPGEIIDLSTDHDCMIYMINLLYGKTWHDTPVRQKRVDQHTLFYTTVIRFGAMLATADGRVDDEELIQLKTYFMIDENTLPDAANIFNDQVYRSGVPSDVLSDFAREFHDAEELKESFLVGMISVALADDELDVEEYYLLAEAARILQLDAAALARVNAATGLNLNPGNEQGSSGQSGTGAEDNYTADPGDSTAELLSILGLPPEGVSTGDIESAYRTLVRKYHPDILREQGMPELEIARAEKVLKQINRAYQILTTQQVH